MLHFDPEDILNIRDSIFESPSDDSTAASTVAELMWHYNATVEPLWSRYVDGYKNAADYLVDCAAAKNERDSLVFPIVFLYRHYLEVQLKDILRMLYLHHGKICKIPNDHNLVTLWKSVRPLMERVYDDPESSDNNGHIEARIEEFSQLDEGSYAFRYPVDTKGEINFKDDILEEGKNVRQYMINLLRVKLVVASMATYLEYVSAGLFVELEVKKQSQS